MQISSPLHRLNFHFCDIMIYKKHTFGHSDDQNLFLIHIRSFSTGSWFTALKTFGISYNKNHKSIFCYANKVTSGKSLGNLKKGTSC